MFKKRNTSIHKFAREIQNKRQNTKGSHILGTGFEPMSSWHGFEILARSPDIKIDILETWEVPPWTLEMRWRDR